MYLAIIVLPLLGSIISGLFGRKVGVTGAQIITCSSVIVTTLFAIVAFIEVGLNNIVVSIHLFRWIDSELLNVSWGFNFDSLTVSMLIPVLIVSCLVHVYSVGYMSHDPHNQRFFSYLSLFTFMMIVLVTSNNFLLMFLGWEGVGICSYLLVNFWFTRIAANQSSISAFLTNRVGDCFLTIGLFAILWSFGNIDYSTVFSLAPYLNENLITIIGVCLLIGAMAKSSQVGLHVWLPMAMEGPTPVSALIHAATMVTAGVYLLMRTSPLIEYSSTVLILCLWIGTITTVFSSLIGLFQQDIKKVIAYSTMSQLGMMVIAVGLSSYNIALFHLVNHAFYKALLFLGAGSVIHAVVDDQDFRKYGALIKFLPLTYSTMLIASLSLVAFPFMTGFYSKDFILESAYGQFFLSSIVVYFIAIIAAMLTTFYSVKVLYLTFLTKPNGPLAYYKQLRVVYPIPRTAFWSYLRLNEKLNNLLGECPPLYSHRDRDEFALLAQVYCTQEGSLFMTLPLIVLAIFSIFFGYITKDIFIGFGSSFFADNSLFFHPSHEILLDTEFAVPSLFKLLPLLLTIFISIISIVFSEFFPRFLVSLKFSSFGYNLFSFFNQRFLIELFYNRYITTLILSLASQTTRILDKGSVELIGPFGLEKGLLTLSKNIASLDSGVITSYALYILVGLLVYILIPYLSLADNCLLLFIVFALLTMINHVIKYPPKPSSFVTIPFQSVIGKNLFTILISAIFVSISCLILLIVKLYKNDKLKLVISKIFTWNTLYRILLCFLLGWTIRLSLKQYDIVFIKNDISFSLYSGAYITISQFVGKCFEFLDLPSPTYPLKKISYTIYKYLSMPIGSDYEDLDILNNLKMFKDKKFFTPQIDYMSASPAFTLSSDMKEMKRPALTLQMNTNNPEGSSNDTPSASPSASAFPSGSPSASPSASATPTASGSGQNPAWCGNNQPLNQPGGNDRAKRSFQNISDPFSYEEQIEEKRKKYNISISELEKIPDPKWIQEWFDEQKKTDLSGNSNHSAWTEKMDQDWIKLVITRKIAILENQHLSNNPDNEPASKNLGAIRCNNTVGSGINQIGGNGGGYQPGGDNNASRSGMNEPKGNYSGINPKGTNISSPMYISSSSPTPEPNPSSQNPNPSDQDSIFLEIKKQLQNKIKAHQKYLTDELDLVNKAITLDDKLPESQKASNNHLKQVQKKYPSFFDEESGNKNNPKEGLNETKNYLQSEKKSWKEPK